MKPILFNTEMVQAILNGEKTQTRRLNKLREINKEPDNWNLQDLSLDPELAFRNNAGDIIPKKKKGLIATFEHKELGECYRNIRSPYKPENILYIRETFADIPETAPGNLHYKASATNADLEWFKEEGWKWKPSIHMPKEAARIFLKVTDIRAERLQNITYTEALAEGIEETKIYNELLDECSSIGAGTGHLPIKAFVDIWNNIYSDKGYDWILNPWIWVIEFEQTEKTN